LCIYVHLCASRSVSDPFTGIPPIGIGFRLIDKLDGTSRTVVGDPIGPRSTTGATVGNAGAVGLGGNRAPARRPASS
jgi:hypothetical protein